METLFIFLTLEASAVYLSFWELDATISMKVIALLFGVFLAAPMFTLHINDLLIRLYLHLKKWKSAARLYYVKLRIMPGMRSENGIRLNMIPIFFKIGDIERAEEFISKIDFLLFRKTILKAYYYMLFGYLLYKKGIYDQAQLKLDAAMQYPESAEWADPKLFQSAIFLKTDPEKGKKMFDELPTEPETYVEPFDDLYIELSKGLK
ncbi:hypothetical protein JXR93_00460 [bacterium]|nr:hypothetical protein [bacterium]